MEASVADRVVGGRYRVLRRLGVGGMSVVHLAEDERLGRLVALKRMHADAPEEVAQRFEREARLGASLNHPNLVSVFDIAVEDDDVLIVMEYVEGETFARRLVAGRLELDAALAVLRPVADALDHAHDRRVVHRDVKPANILLGPRGTVKLADLGIATAAEGTAITRSGALLGTPAYMAPEQLQGGEISRAVDIYALAAVAFEALTGQKARTGRTPIEVAQRTVSEPPPDARDIWEDASPALAHALKRGMSRDPGERPPSAGAFVEELAAVGAAVGRRRLAPSTAAGRTRVPAPVEPAVVAHAAVKPVAVEPVPVERAAVKPAAVVQSAPVVKPAAVVESAPAAEPAEVERDSPLRPPVERPVVLPAAIEPARGEPGAPALPAPVPLAPTATPPPVRARAHPRDGAPVRPTPAAKGVAPRAGASSRVGDDARPTRRRRALALLSVALVALVAATTALVLNRDPAPAAPAATAVRAQPAAVETEAASTDAQRREASERAAAAERGRARRSARRARARREAAASLRSERAEKQRAARRRAAKRSTETAAAGRSSRETGSASSSSQAGSDTAPSSNAGTPRATPQATPPAPSRPVTPAAPQPTRPAPPAPAPARRPRSNSGSGSGGSGRGDQPSQVFDSQDDGDGGGSFDSGG